MKYMIKIFGILVALLVAQSCGYGDKILKVIHPETISLIERSNSKNAVQILKTREYDEWFFIPQVITRIRDDRLWAAVRIYSRDADIYFKIRGNEVSFSKDSPVELTESMPSESKWNSTSSGWFCKVIGVKAYSYSSIAPSGVDSIRVSFDVFANENFRTESFALEVRIFGVLGGNA